MLQVAISFRSELLKTGHSRGSYTLNIYPQDWRQTEKDSNTETKGIRSIKKQGLYKIMCAKTIRRGSPSLFKGKEEEMECVGKTECP